MLPMSRQPSRSRLKQTVTLWNRYGEAVVDGACQTLWQKTTFRYVRTEIRRRTNMMATGDQEADSLLLFIFNGPSVAVGEDGVRRKYVEPHTYQNASDGQRAVLWTLREGDFIGLGKCEGDPSEGGERVRKDYRVTIVDPKRGDGTEIHHWEVSGA